MMTPIQKFPADVAKTLLGVFFDIDDTFTTHGKIGPEPFQALWSLKKAGLKSVPITGRPAGWCDLIARQWPVAGVVGENGAFYFWYDQQEKKVKKRFMDPDPVREEKRRRLSLVKEEILRAVPGTALASDQQYREADLAIDYCEDVTPLPWKKVEKICGIFKNHGATCKVSSVHVNGWFGDYDKLAMTRRFFRDQWQVELEAVREEAVFCGDSPNDEPLFARLETSVGVANIAPFLSSLRHPPRYVTALEGGKGFAELAGIVLSRRR